MTKQGFQDFLLDNSQFLYPSAIKLTKSSVLADDLVQETIYKALKNWDKFKEGTNIKSWLYTIMRNIFINDYRKKKKRNTIHDNSETQFLFDSISHSSNNIGEENLLEEEIKLAMSKVGKDMMEPFNMHYIGYKYNEIAETLNIPLGTVKSKIFFAKKAMRKSLAEVGIYSASA